jgi:hypothetical protein
MAIDVKVRRQTVAQAMNRLETSIKRFERRYEVSSAKMRREVKAGRMKETAEVATWMMNCNVLDHLKRRSNGHTTGTRTKIT